MWTKLLTLLGAELIKQMIVALTSLVGAIVKWLNVKSKNAEHKKEIKARIKEVMNEKDPVVRAKRINDILNS